ncbi:MAG: hypothetical protein JXP34_27910 [Planctomycetes bacterium]|nr:hypothetical protein [Planctomycetota bacterium]
MVVLSWTAVAALASLAAAPADPPPPICAYSLAWTRSLDRADPRRVREAWDACHVAAALQGLANRDAPRLYLRYLPEDDYWLEKLRKKPGGWLAGRSVEEAPTLDDLLDRFRDAYRGLVVYDERVPATSNVASTIAGCASLLPVRYDPQGLYAHLVDRGIPVVSRLLGPDGDPLFTGRGEIPGTGRASTGSAKCDAYLWALETPPGRDGWDPGFLAYYIDAYWLERPGLCSPEQHTLTNHDFFVARRAFFFDLGPWDDETPVDDRGQPAGTDARTLRAILRAAHERTAGARMIHAGGFVPWAWKYTNHGIAGGTHDPVPSEWRYAEILSCFNAYMDADAIGLAAMANASFFQHAPRPDRMEQGPRPTREDLIRDGHITAGGAVAPIPFVAFYVGDYDSAAWLYHMIPKTWDDPARGSVPLGWAFNPNLEERMRPALLYAWRTRSPADVFIAGDSGAGYLNPGYIDAPRPHSQLPSGLETWMRHCRGYYERWDIGLTGFIIDGYAAGLSEDALAAYATFSPAGIVAQKVPPIDLVGAMPILRMDLDLGGSPKDAARAILGRLRGSGPDFRIFRTILQRPSWHAEVVREVRAARPEVRFVDPYVLLALVREHVTRTRATAPFRDAPAVSFAPGGPDRGLEIARVPDGPFEIVEAAGRRAIRCDGIRAASYLYVRVADGFAFRPDAPLEITLIHRAEGPGRFTIEYDARDRGAPHAGTYKATPWVAVEPGEGWSAVAIPLPDPRLTNRQNGDADFRIVVSGTTLLIAEIEVRKRPEGEGR